MALSTCARVSPTAAGAVALNTPGACQPGAVRQRFLRVATPLRGDAPSPCSSVEEGRLPVAPRTQAPRFLLVPATEDSCKGVVSSAPPAAVEAAEKATSVAPVAGTRCSSRWRTPDVEANGPFAQEPAADSEAQLVAQTSGQHDEHCTAVEDEAAVKEMLPNLLSPRRWGFRRLLLSGNESAEPIASTLSDECVDERGEDYSCATVVPVVLFPGKCENEDTSFTDADLCSIAADEAWLSSSSKQSSVVDLSSSATTGASEPSGDHGARRSLRPSRSPSLQSAHRPSASGGPGTRCSSGNSPALPQRRAVGPDPGRGRPRCGSASAMEGTGTLFPLALSRSPSSRRVLIDIVAGYAGGQAGNVREGALQSARSLSTRRFSRASADAASPGTRASRERREGASGGCRTPSSRKSLSALRMSSPSCLGKGRRRRRSSLWRQARGRSASVGGPGASASSAHSRTRSPSRSLSVQPSAPRPQLRRLALGELSESESWALAEELLFQSLPRENVVLQEVTEVAGGARRQDFLNTIRTGGGWSQLRVAWHLPGSSQAVSAIMEDGIRCDEDHCACGRYGRGGYVALSAAKANAYAPPADGASSISAGCEGPAQGVSRQLFMVLALPEDDVVQGERGVRPPRTAADLPGHPTEYCFVDSSRLLCALLLRYTWIATGRREKVTTAGPRASHVVSPRRPSKSRTTVTDA